MRVLAVSQSGRVRTVTAITGGSSQRETSSPSAAAAADVTLLVAFAALSRDSAEFGMTLMCHLDLDARPLPAERPTRPDVFSTVRVHANGRGGGVGSGVVGVWFGFLQAEKCGSLLHNPTRAGFLGRHLAAEAGPLWLLNAWV